MIPLAVGGSMDKVREYFGDMCVKKSSLRDVFATLSIPSFIRDWFIQRYADSDGGINVSFAQEKIKDILPRSDEWNRLLDRIMSGENVKFVAKICVRLDIKTNEVTFSLPDYGVRNSDTRIPQEVWDRAKEKLLCGDGDVWGVLTLGYVRYKVSDKKTEGKIILKEFNDFTPYKVDLAYYKKARENFELEEWIDLLLMAIDYNSVGYKNIEQKLMMLSRLLPFVEKRLNLIELAPKGTGKSYVFSQISKRGWLVSGGVMTRAKLFYDMKDKQEGLVAYYDYVAMDEIATIKFPDMAEMQGALKSYLESGTYNVGIKAGKADAGMIMLGNIAEELMNVDTYMLGNLPSMFDDSALIDRFHGFIEGWKIPRMNENLKAEGWALNSEYFAEIMHELRDDIAIKDVVDKLLSVPEGADTRDTTAVKRLASAYVKLLFPAWDCIDKVDFELFDKYCLKPAVNMRSIIKKQLKIMDIEFRGQEMAEYTVVELTAEER